MNEAKDVKLFLASEPKRAIKNMKIVILDDDDTQVLILESVLRRAGFQNLYSFSNPGMMSEVYQAERPDLLILDLHMPRISGLEIMRNLNYLVSDAFFPILVLTANAHLRTKEEALGAGAKDFITKPFNLAEVLLRVQNLLEMRSLYLELQHQKEQLETLLEKQTRQLEQAQVEMLTRLAKISEYRLGDHVWRVATLSAMLAKELEQPGAFVDLLLPAARFHDIGKIAIPDGILLKSGQLSPEEFELIKKHTLIGAQLLAGGSSTLMRMAELIALSHHERWDGLGYPQGLQGEAIPLEGRIVAVADAFDTMTHQQPYQGVQSTQEAIAELQQHRNTQFDPKVVDACWRLYQQSQLSSI
jgi:putative two-component system response regulator